jgi:hypothetical protein
MSIAALAVGAAQLCMLAGCASEATPPPSATNPWADGPAANAPTPLVAATPLQQPIYAPVTQSQSPNPNVGGTRHGMPVTPQAPAAPAAPPAPVAAPALPPPPPAPAPKAAKPAATHHAAKAAAPAKAATASAPIAIDAHTRTQAPLRGKPALESAGKQILGTNAPLRLITQLENDAGMWWYVETESGNNGWLRDSEIQR